jgi:enoyl-CoA hydratase/carnithine racemase
MVWFGFWSKEAFNAFNNQQHAEMRQAIDMYAADDSLWCCIITGSGRGFVVDF